MNKLQVNLEQENRTFNANTYPARSHYKSLMYMGRVFPTTKAQAMLFVNNGLNLSVLNSKDVEVVEEMLNKHGFEGNYKYTKSRTWVRLQNGTDLIAALKAEYLS